jgi:fructokinase
MRLGAIEAGGTKFVLAVGSEEGTVFVRQSIPTTTPDETLAKVLSFFTTNPVDRLGIGTFGPVDLNPESETYGSILQSPKLAWRGVNYFTALARLNVPMMIDTDVNVCALSESVMGSAQDVDSCVYITVGTGIGGGAVVNGTTITGLQHPEMGHVPVIKHPKDPFAGRCPSHSNCLEGLASGPAIEDRFGVSAKELGPDHLAWEIEADYLAQAVYTYALTLSPKKVILGGGVMNVPGLLEQIRTKFISYNNGYLAHLESVENYIVRPGLGEDVGIIGCFLLSLE